MLKKGDLIQLSAYGKKLKLLERFKDDVGIIMSESPIHAAHVMWASGVFFHVNRRDIKKVIIK